MSVDAKSSPKILLRGIKFALVGGSGVIVNAGLLYVFTTHCQLDYRIASAIAIETAIINNFIWHTMWTWSDRKAVSSTMFARRFAKFNLSAACTSAIFNWGLLVLLTEYANIPHIQISNLIGVGAGMAANFLLGNFWIFRGVTATNTESAR